VIGPSLSTEGMIVAKVLMSSSRGMGKGSTSVADNVGRPPYQGAYAFSGDGQFDDFTR
jgi:hypothetical protein